MWGRGQRVPRWMPEGCKVASPGALDLAPSNPSVISPCAVDAAMSAPTSPSSVRIGMRMEVEKITKDNSIGASRNWSGAEGEQGKEGIDYQERVEVVELCRDCRRSPTPWRDSYPPKFDSLSTPRRVSMMTRKEANIRFEKLDRRH